MSAFEDNLGKIAEPTFKEVLLHQCGYANSEVIVGPSFGVDTSIIDIGDGWALAVCSDPLSLIPAIGAEASAWLSVHLIANDMATTGFGPKYAQFVLNLPATMSMEAFKEYWGHIHRFCEALEVAITGGHTGQIEGQNSTISGGGTMFLTAPKSDIITSENANPGDVIVVTKEAALVSTSILALCFPQTVKNKLGQEIHQSACENFYHTSVLKEALLASEVLVPNIELTAMHDVTEGGILGAIGEMAGASGCGFRVDNELLPIGPVVEAVAGLFEIDPRFCVGAGSMIIAVKEGHESKLLAHLAAHSVEAAVVGKFSELSEGSKIIENGEEKPVVLHGKDPYWNAFYEAFKTGLK